MASKKNTDITKVGPLNWKLLQVLNSLNEEALVDDRLANALVNLVPTVSPHSIEENMPHDIQTPLYNQRNQNGFADYWGNSMFDESYATEYDLEHLGDIRANNMPTLAKWGAGLGKGLVLAGTTFLDGSLGLVYGIGSSLNNINNENETGVQTFSRIFDNEISNGLQLINKLAEEWMPNYESEVEQNKPWWLNIGTANFWADGVLKNMGFMVGAFYSGGAWTKVLNYGAKGLQAAKGAISTTKSLAEAYKAAGGIGTMGARIMGATLSATNEARIEANLNSSQWKELEYQKAADIYGIDVETLMSDPQYTGAVNAIDNAGAKVGAIDFWSNLPILAINDYLMFAKLYSRGFSSAVDNASNIARAGERQGSWLSRTYNRLKNAGDKGLELEAREASNIVLEGGKYVAKQLSNKLIWGNVLKLGAREGNEEMAQLMAANLAGDLYETDSPDAYINALNNPNAQLKANDFMASAIKAFNDSYGNGDLWEQFAIGAISALIGVPTVGRVNNSDANTYLGKGKMLGMSGGLFGEFSSAKAANKEASKTVDVMNKVVDRIKSQQRVFAMHNSFTDAMDGFSEEQDKFEYKNAEDNLGFVAILAFSNAGRLDDLKELVDLDFENMSAEEMGKIALLTTKQDKDGNPIGGWQTEDGHPMARVDEDGKIVIEEPFAIVDKLEEKREEILKQIDAYGKAILRVRGIGNNSLTDEQNQELAWLLWKGDLFKDRYKSIKTKNDDVFASLMSSLIHWEEALSEERKNLTEDEDGVTLTQNTNMLANVRAVKGFLNLIQLTDNPIALVGFLKNNPEFVNLLKSEDFYEFIDAFSYQSGLNFSRYSEAIQDLIDCERLAFASSTFNERYKEFVTDPMSVIAGRNKKETQNKAKAEASSNVNKRDAINRASVSDLVSQMELGVSADELSSIFENNAGEHIPSPEEAELWRLLGKAKVEAAREIVDTKNMTALQLTTLLSEGKITLQQYDDAIALLNNAVHSSEDASQLADLSSFAYNDPSALSTGDIDESITPEDLAAFLEERVAEAKNALAQAQDNVETLEEGVANIPDADDELDNIVAEIVEDIGGEELKGAKEEAEKKRATTTPRETPKEDVGHDATPTVESENERRLTEEEDKKNKEKREAAPTNPKNLASTIMSILTEELDADAAALIEFSLKDSVNNVVQELSKLKDTGVGAIEAIHSIKDTKAMLDLATVAGGKVQQIEEAIQRWWGITLDSEQPIIEASEIETEEPIINTEEAFTSEETINQFAIETSNAITAANNSIAGTLQYWKPTTTEVPIGFLKGTTTPFYILAWEAKNADGSPKYTLEQVNRFEALYKYLLGHNAFDNAFDIKEGDIVNFIIDPALNEKAGETVILMSVNGKIVGDLMSPNDASFNRQVGLSEFVSAVTAEYDEWKKDNTGIFTSQNTSKVSKKMVGKVPYGTSRRPLNDIYKTTDSEGNETNVDFKLGIQVNEEGNRVLMTPGRTRRQGISDEELTIISPLKSKAGQPYLLMPTGSGKRAYIPVPISMKRYGDNTKNSKIYNEVDKVLQKLTTIKKGEEMAFIRELQELLCIPAVHLNITSEGRIKLTIKAVNDNKQTTLYEGSTSYEGMLNTIKTKLYGTPYLVSRKYINTTYKDGTEYNRMIGEIAECNIQRGTPFNTWFTINPIIGGKEEKAKNPKSTKNNPNIKDALFTQYTYSSSSGTHVVAVDNKTYDIYLWDNKTNAWVLKPNAKDARATSFKAQTYINNNHITPNSEGLVQTPWGTYNVSKGTFVDTQVSNTDAISHTPVTEDKADAQNKDFVQNNQVQQPPLQQEPQQTPSDKTKTEGINTPKEVTQEQLNKDEPASIDSSRPTLSATEDKGKHNEAAEVGTLEGRRSIEVKDHDGNTHTIKVGDVRRIDDGMYPGVSTIIRINDDGTITDSYYDETSKTTEERTLSLDSYKSELDYASESRPSSSTSSRPTVPTQKTDEDCNREAISKGLLVTNAHKQMWQTLSTAQKATIVGLPKLKAKRVINNLARNFDVKNNTFKGDIDTIISDTRNKEVTEEKGNSIDINKEVKWLERVLPNLSSKDKVRIVNGLIKISDSPNGAKAWGQFRDSVITISRQAARGTMYHEAFHAVVNTLMEDSEIDTMFEEAAIRYGDMNTIALEERLAEDFRRYVLLEETPILGKAVKLFRTLKHLIQSIRGKETYLDNLFYRIQRGKLATRTPHESNYSRYREEEWTSEMQAIKQKAIADGTFMKAPNGKPTNLNERQWLQVRTTNFKNWFGDWENDPANASKVVDENGEPLVVYHSNYTLDNPIERIETFELDSRPNRFQKGVSYDVFNNLSIEDRSKLISTNFVSFTNTHVVVTQSAGYTKKDREFNFKHAVRTAKSVNVNLEGVSLYNPSNFKGNQVIEDEELPSAYFTTKKHLKYVQLFGNNIGAYFLSIKNPLTFDALDKKHFKNNDFGTNNIKLYTIVKDGFDGAQAYLDTRPEYVVAHPNQVKSATDNNGDWQIMILRLLLINMTCLKENFLCFIVH